MIASLLVAILTGVLFASFFLPLRAVGAGRRELAGLEETAVFLGRLSEEVAGVYPEEQGFTGFPDAVSFVTSAGTNHGLRRTGYQVREVAGEERVGVYRAEGLPYEEIDLDGGVAVFQADRLVFRYYDGKEWLDEWDRPEIPRLVSLEMANRGREFQCLFRPRAGADSDADPDRGPGPGGG